jgi:hypothetical protein
VLSEEEEAMKRFLATYMGSADGAARAEWQRLDADARKAREKEGFDAWGAWGRDHAAHIVEQGAPIGRTKRAGRDGITDIHNAVTAYVIVEAEDHAAAARLFADHPHFTIFPGDSVEIMEILPMPTG